MIFGAIRKCDNCLCKYCQNKPCTQKIKIEENCPACVGSVVHCREAK